MTEQRKKKKTSKPAKPTRGGARAGSGRDSLFPGKDRSRHATAYFQADTWAHLDKIREALTKRHGREITVSDTIEHAVRKCRADAHS